MMPPQLHMHLEEWFSAGILPTITVGEPGTHGDVVTGTHGIGVRTPAAAAVAEATVGLDNDWHMPNGRMLTIGWKSIIFAIGMPPTIVRLLGSTIRVLGAMPKLHWSAAPAQTAKPMGITCPNHFSSILLLSTDCGNDFG